MPKRRDYQAVLRRFEAIPPVALTDDPRHAWPRVLETSSPPVLAALVRVLMDRLPERTRLELQRALAVAEVAYRDPDMVSENVQHVQRTAKAILSGRRQRRSGCDSIALIRHMGVIDQVIRTLPKSLLRRVERLRSELPGVLQSLDAFPCGVQGHRSRRIPDHEVKLWVYHRTDNVPLPERIAAFHHKTSPKMMHKRISASFSALERALRT